jgi:hypothetical protein
MSLVSMLLPSLYQSEKLRIDGILGSIRPEDACDSV